MAKRSRLRNEGENNQNLFTFLPAAVALSRGDGRSRLACGGLRFREEE